MGHVTSTISSHQQTDSTKVDADKKATNLPNFIVNVYLYFLR